MPDLPHTSYLIPHTPWTICFDFGNTRLKYAIFEGKQLHKEAVLQDDKVSTINMIIEEFKPERSILSSVIDHNPDIEILLNEKTSYHKLSHLTRLNFTTPVGKPSSIGADRLALVAASIDLFPKKNNLAIGLGTCITYNFVNKNHESLEMFTAKLPLVKEDWNFPLIGYDTVTNILSGVIIGMAKEIDGFIDAYAERYDNFNVLLTGGNSTYFVPHLKKQIFADPNLIFKGLYAISEYNYQSKN